MKRALVFVSLLAGCMGTLSLQAEPLKIGYSDWPGWVAWEVAIQKGWFEEAGVDVEFIWFEYVPSMEAFAAGQIDAVCMTNGDALVTGSAGKRSKGILINDYSNGNDMIVARPGIDSIKDLRGKRVGVEVSFVDHLLLLKGLEAHGMSEEDIVLVNMPTNDTPQALAAGGVDAVAAWNPVGYQALKQVPGAKAIFTSREVPGLIYDLLYVDRASLARRRADWLKVVDVWFRVVDFIRDPATQDEAVEIMSARVGTSPEQYKRFLAGTHLLDVEGNLEAYATGLGLDSVYGSSDVVNSFFIDKRVYDRPQNVEAFLEVGLVEELARQRGLRPATRTLRAGRQ